MKMVSRWLATAVVIGILLTIVASDSSEELKEHRQEEESHKESEIIRQYYQHLSASRDSFINRRPSYPIPDSSPTLDGVGFIQYDPAVFGFEIPKPQNVFKAFEQSDPFKSSSPYSLSDDSSFESELPWIIDPNVKPLHPREITKYPEYPQLIFRGNKPEKSKPSYKPENTYPIIKDAQYPEIPIKYDEKNPYSCPKIAGYESHCRPAKDCAVWYDLALTTPGTACKLVSHGHPGICCPLLPFNSRKGVALKLSKKNVKLEKPCIDIYSVNSAAHAGRFQLRLMDEMEKNLVANNVTVRPRSSSYTHLQFFQKTTESQELSRAALTAIETTRELTKRFELTPEEAGLGLSRFHLKNTILSNTCPPVPVCDQRTLRSPFRKLDGSCNNLKRTFWGQSRTPFQRAIVPDYADGVWLPRKGRNNRELPSPRLVSVSVVLDKDAPAATETHWVMQYGQFINHDIALTNLFRTRSSAAIQCCTEEGKLLNKTELIHPQCLPIKIPIDDPFFSKFGQRCMNFVRSTPAPRSDCSLGYGEQMNGNTHFLDHSNVYGSDDATAIELRTFVKGGLKVNHQNPHLDLLPPDNTTETNCTLSKPVSGVALPVKVKCFKAGDTRPNQTPNLAVTHTIFIRQHNKLVTELAYLNPTWEDERLYQVARRILIAQMQHITYNEWLPIIIGRAKMQELGLLPLQRGFSDDYDEYLNPNILNEFSAAAFRFGHSLIQGKHDLINHRRKKEVQILLRQHFTKMQTVYTPGNLDKFLIGLATQPSQNFDNYFTEEVTNHLFEEQGKGFGLDLVSLNIQRGRERGIPGYNAFRKLCALAPAKNFNDLKDLIPEVIVERFELLYESVDDIDFFIAGVSERKVKGAMIGPTFQCIVADQFLRLKRGDRFFYDLAGQTGSFTEEQLDEIRKTSFARLVCDNSNVLHTQPLIFKTESAVNQVVSCESPSIPNVSLLPWQEIFEKSY